MVFSNPEYPALSRFFARAAARAAARTVARKRRGIRSRLPVRPTKMRRLNTWSPNIPPRVLTYKARVRNQVGESLSTVPANLYQVKSDGSALRDTNTLAIFNPVGMDRKSTTSQNLNDREGDVIYLGGVKISMVLRNALAASLTNNLHCNVAFISTKAGAPAAATSQLFTSPAGTQRTSDFANAALTSLERHTLPICTDNYNVHWHRRFILSSTSTVGGADPSFRLGPNFLTLDKYIPINRQIRFNSATGAPETAFHVLVWVGLVGEAAGVASTANAYALDYNFVTNFRDP